jgi:hypothetical protein
MLAQPHRNIRYDASAVSLPRSHVELVSPRHNPGLTMRRSAACLLSVLALLAIASPAVAEDGIVISREEIPDHADADIALERSIVLERKIADRLVYVDWRIVPIVAGDEVPLTTEACFEIVNQNPPLGNRHFTFLPYGNTHAVISVDIGNPARFPLNGMDCQVLDDGINYAVRLRGLYSASVSQIPTASSISLEPAETSNTAIQWLDENGAFKE